jgi:hypothetical protein
MQCAMLPPVSYLVSSEHMRSMNEKGRFDFYSHETARGSAALDTRDQVRLFPNLSKVRQLQGLAFRAPPVCHSRKRLDLADRCAPPRMLIQVILSFPSTAQPSQPRRR